jgi:methionine biosynthesis protein MetW
MAVSGRQSLDLAGRPDAIRVDLKMIADMIEAGARVLDVGCGEGSLLYYLVHRKNVDGRGIEISQAGVNACVRNGLSAVQGDADTDLKDYPSQSFDYVVLSQTLQATRSPLSVLLELLRIGRYGIVSFPNFGHWRCRWQLLVHGRMPVTDALGNPWYATPNIHLCTIADFTDMCRDQGISVVRRYALNDRGGLSSALAFGPLANLFGEQGLFLLTRRPPQPAR